ncbi:SNF1-related protein kinase regulatory subunit gamma-1-like isoform X2 [Quercus lobata]|uniref:SNF1-related protein kinase regulatory subunit gamma-1-like isoform X2 n=1 Tax=Quercus lobata TaxID=97700 RepID=UPI001245ABA7|nr:SNF1-related protein kinase regulatory subunit gamma-1-like isoform X2 [Quercus lobata]
MDLKYIENVMKDSESGMMEKKETLISNSNKTEHGNQDVDYGTALQLILDHIPISSIPGIKNSSVLELRTGDSVRDAIHMLYEKDVFGAPIADVLGLDESTSATRRFSDKYIGFIDFASMVLWCLEELEMEERHTNGNGGKAIKKNGFTTMLEQNPDIGQTKNAVIQLLLKSSGIEWFDSIADKALSEIRFENEEHVAYVYGDQSIAEALHALRESQIGAIAVINRGSKKLIGSIRRSDIHLIIENDNLLHNRKNLTAEEFVHMETNSEDFDPLIEQDLGALLSSGTLCLRNRFLPRMDSPVTNKKTDTLKQVMKNIAETKSSFSFLIDDMQQATGVLTLRDIIIQFAPPCIDSSIHGGGFFESALQQTGCHVENGTLACNH